MTTTLAYSDMKAAWHLDRIAQLRAGLQPPPVELQLILSDLCNHDCFFCAYRAETGLSSEQFVEYHDGERVHNPNRMIPREKALSILEDAAALGVKSIIFTGGGEPTVHPHHLALMARALDLGMHCSLNTNGGLLRSGWEEVFRRLTYVRFSVDAGSAEDYARIRRVPVGQYEKTLDNLRRVVDVCAPDCTVGAGYVVTPDNWQNLVAGVRRIRETGAAYVRLASMQSTEQFHPFDGVMEEVRGALAAAREEETADFEVVDLFDIALGHKAAAPLCGMQHFVLYIGGNQRVYRCCYTAYSKIGEIGDLTNQSFAEWFHSSDKKAKLAEFDARSCFVCPLEHKNRTIRYMVDPSPMHVDFV